MTPLVTKGRVSVRQATERGGSKRKGGCVDGDRVTRHAGVREKKRLQAARQGCGSIQPNKGSCPQGVRTRAFNDECKGSGVGWVCPICWDRTAGADAATVKAICAGGDRRRVNGIQCTWEGPQEGFGRQYGVAVGYSQQPRQHRGFVRKQGGAGGGLD